MNNSHGTPRPGVSRRTVAKGMAWTVPVVTVASATPAFAASPAEPPDPEFDFDTAWKNPGGSCTEEGCIQKHSYGVTVAVTNPSPDDYIIQFTSYTIGTTNVGVYGVVDHVNEALPGFCQPVTGSCALGVGCASLGVNATNSVCVPSGSELTMSVNSGDYGSSPNVGQEIGWRWILKSDCSVVSSDTATSAVSPPNSIC